MLDRQIKRVRAGGAVTVAEVDADTAHGPGLRSTLMGPCLLSSISALVSIVRSGSPGRS